MSTNETKHTAGPWSVDSGPTHPHHQIKDAEDNRIAFTEDHEHDSEANAALIAASPDLLLIVESYVAENECCCREADLKQGTCLYCLAVASIAKAKGTP